jgi:hypothetical protein
MSDLAYFDYETIIPPVGGQKEGTPAHYLVEVLIRNPVFMGLRDPVLILSAPTFAQLQTSWKSSPPSRNTIISTINFLQARGASLNYLSKDWMIAAIVTSTAGLKGIGGTIVTESDYSNLKEAGETAIIAGEVSGVLGAEPLAAALIVAGAGAAASSYLLELIDVEGLPMTDSGTTVESSGGGDQGGSGSGAPAEAQTQNCDKPKGGRSGQAAHQAAVTDDGTRADESHTGQNTQREAHEVQHSKRAGALAGDG